MPTLAEVRQKYPQYSDLSDGQLADALHRRFYSDMDRAEFDGKIGLSEAPAAKPSPAGTLPAGVRVRRGFADSGMPDTSMTEGPASGFQMGEANAMLAQEQGVSPMSGGPVLGEAVQSDAGFGFYDEAGKFTLANERDHVVLKDPQTGRLSVMARDPSMNEGPGMGMARMFLQGAAGGAPTRLAGGGAMTARAPSMAAQTVQAFDRSDVDPSLVTALESRAAKVGAEMLKNTPAGGPVQRSVVGNTEQAGARAERIAGTLTDVGDAATAGGRVREGASEFVEATIPARQSQLYNEASNLIGDAGVSPLSHTLQTLRDIEGQISSPAIREFLTDSNAAALTATIRADAPKGVSFNDLRELRSRVRKLKPSQDTKVGISKTVINRIYDSLTRDMETLARRSGGEDAVTALKKADLFTFRMLGAEGAPVKVLRELTEGKSDEAIYAKLMQWSGKTAGADVRNLELVKRAVPQERWNDFVGAMIRNMGRATPGQVSAADAPQWSPASFMTSYERLSPRARTLLFNENAALRSALDDLLIVAGKLKEVARLGNPSGSGSHMISAGTGAGVFAAPITTLTTLGLGNAAARILTNPTLARKLTGAYRIALQTRNMPAARADMSWRSYIRSLSGIAANDNEAAQALAKLVETLRQSGRPEREETGASRATIQ